MVKRSQVKFVIISNYTSSYACDLCDKQGTKRTKMALQSHQYTQGHLKKKELMEARKKAEKTFGKWVLCLVCCTNSLI